VDVLRHIHDFAGVPQKAPENRQRQIVRTLERSQFDNAAGRKDQSDSRLLIRLFRLALGNFHHPYIGNIGRGP
jgi:hypothetical protein